MKLALLSLIASALWAQWQSVTLTWTDPNTPATNSYNVYRMTGTCPAVQPATTAGFTLLNEYPIIGMSYTDASVGTSTAYTYCYVVTAVTAGGESAPSQAVGISIPPFPPGSLTLTKQ